MSDTDLLPTPEPAHRPTRVLWVVVGVLLIAAVAAAVLTQDDRSPAERVAAAPGAVASSGSYSFEITVDAEMGAVSNSFGLTGSVDAEAKRSSASFDLGGGAMQLVSDGTVLYLQVPEAARASTGGKAWAKLDVGEVMQGFGGLGSSTDPTASFENLRQASGTEVEDLGSEDVRGTSTRHFRTELDLTSQLDSMGGAGAAALGPMREQLKAVPVDVWLDGDDRIRRQRTTLDLAGLGAGKVVTTVEAFDYGKAVTIEVPAADEVFEGDMSSLGALFGAGS